MSRYSDSRTYSQAGAHTYSQAGDWLMSTVRRNPEALLLLGAGCCLLMRSRSSLASAEYSPGYGSRSQRSDGASDFTERASRWSDQASSARQGLSRAAQSAGDYASDVKDRVSSTAGAYAESVSEFASDAGRQVYETTERLTRQARSSLESGFDRVLRDQPLAVAIAGLAAGAAVAAAFPSTDIENRTLGQARERLSDAASRAGENLMGAASKAGERLKSAAAEKGLTAEGIKDAAAEAAETFTSAAKGQANDLGSATVVPEGPKTDMGGSESRSSGRAGVSSTGGRSNR